MPHIQTQTRTDPRSHWLALPLGVFLLTLAAQVSLPILPVPVTLQTLALLLIGLYFPVHAAWGSALAYIALGALGAPVFSSWQGGLWVLLGPRGGYLFGFILALGFMAWVRHHPLWRPHLSSPLNLAIFCLLALSLVFIPGVAYLGYWIGFEKAMLLGFWPFVLPEIGKMAALVLLRPRKETPSQPS